MRNKTDESDSWIAHLMDDDSIPLDELINTVPRPAAQDAIIADFPAAEETTEPLDAWNFPDLNMAEAPDVNMAEGSSDVSFDATPFADETPLDFDDSMLDLEPIGHESNSFATANGFGDLEDDPNLQTPLPNVFDRRSDEPISIGTDETDGAPATEYLPTLEDLHTGPVGPEASAMLDAFGLSDGATWIELRERYVTMVGNCRPDEEATLAMQTELAVLRREINSQYASLRLLAAP